MWRMGWSIFRAREVSESRFHLQALILSVFSWLEAFASCRRCSQGEAGPSARRFLRVDAPVHARLALLSPQAASEVALSSSQERVEATTAALKGQMDEESGEEAATWCY